MSSKDTRKGFGTLGSGNQAGQPANGLNPLHEVALRLAAMGKTKSKSRTRELVAMLLGHGARAWRSSQPRVRLHLHVISPDGNHSIRMRIH